MAQIKLGPAVVELQKVFPTGVYFRTDPRLFDELVRFITEPFRGSEYQKASIRLVHPTTPDAAPALSYIRSHMEHLSKAEYHAKFGPRLNVSTNMYFFLRRTERTLREQDSPEDADYVDRLLHEFVEGQEYQALEAKYWSVVNSTKGPRDKWLKASRKLDDGDEGKKPLRPVWRKR
ncbi:hypothetical protein B0A55_01328 [Friedmanniomyces simplex]|uniref:Uncharacterized protein n=1 Tax=Friedmanniomyces simplex TaxID=329884 RepID=A0A4U0XY63_9PEZI|nr:hypothetical protein B0A55_01328 [Friedmanniomyces simplex]